MGVNVVSMFREGKIAQPRRSAPAALGLPRPFKPWQSAHLFVNLQEKKNIFFDSEKWYSIFYSYLLGLLKNIKLIFATEIVPRFFADMYGHGIL